VRRAEGAQHVTGVTTPFGPKARSAFLGAVTPDRAEGAIRRGPREPVASFALSLNDPARGHGNF